MKKVIVMFSVILMSCQKTRPEYFKPTVESVSDTVLNGSIYNAKLFFTNDSLLRIAKNNGIQDILDVKFENNVNGDLIFIPVLTKAAMIKGDTAYVSFEVDVDSLVKGRMVEYFWNYHMAVDYLPNETSRDTVFSEMVRIFVRG